MAPTPRPGILDIEPYVGGQAHLAGVSRVARLASNENPLGPSPDASHAYAELAHDLHRYPDGGSTALRHALAEVHDLDPARIVCGNGSDELISLLARAYAGPGDEVVYSAHGFLMYPIAATTAGATTVSVPEKNLTADVDAILNHITERTKIVFLANPNNPTGTYLSGKCLARLHAGLPAHVLLVVDAAYAEYTDANDYADGAELVERADNVVMTRTFSKIYGLAALRLGWAYCPPSVVDVLNRVRAPFNVTKPAQAAGVAAVRDREHVQRSIEHNIELRNWFRQQTARFDITALPSQANFVLLAMGDAASADALEAHFKTHGVLARAMGKYGLPAHLRVTIGTEADMRQAVDALADFRGPAA
jgi:histidinol-phosphate aminotransferase